MSGLIVGQGGEITLPNNVCGHYGVTGGSSLRLIETSAGILLVTETDAPVTDELVQELAEWQALSLNTWARFTYEE